jgi:hypothetical protein
VAQLPEDVRGRILDGLTEGGMRMGPPAGSESMPAVALQALDALFKVWLTDAINTSFVVGAGICVAGGLCALALRSHVDGALPATGGKENLPATTNQDTRLQ